MLARIRVFLVVLALTIIPTVAIWLPFFIRLEKLWNIPLPRDGMATIVANFDGPLYLVVAKTFYEASPIKENFAFGLPVQYYAAHFPLFPLLIRLIGTLSGNFPYAMLSVSVVSSFAAIYFFYKLASLYTTPQNSFWLTFVFAVFPARWLVVRSVGSPEPLFTAGIIASIYFFKEKKYLYAGIAGAIAQLTKSPGILLFVAYALYLILPKLQALSISKLGKWLKSIELKKYPLLLIPLSLLGVFFLYSLKFNDFFAYFKSGDNIHLFFPPFQIFNYSAPWVGTFWLEEVIFVYLFGALGLLYLIKQKDWLLASFVGVFFLSTIFVSHRDLIRYSLPIVPFLLIGFREVIVKREFKIVILFLLIPIYLFSLAYISQNVMSISNWSPLL